VLFSDESDFFVQGKHSRCVRINSFSVSETGSLKPIEGTTHSDKCIGEIERKVITDMRRAFPETEGVVQETQIIMLDWSGNSLYPNSIENF